MKASLLFFAFLCVISSVSASAALKGLDFMVAGKEAVEIADTWQITHSADGKVVEAAISPDGKKVAFLVERDECCDRHLCLVSSTGGSVTTVMKSNGEPTGAPGETKTAWILHSYRPVWSADGRYIYLTAQEETVIDDIHIGRELLLVFSSRGEYVTQVCAPDNIQDLYITSAPLVSPDGRHVLTAAQDPERQSGQATPYGAVVFDVARGTSRFLASGGVLLSPVWSADGKTVWLSAYEREHGDGLSKPVIRELNVETGESRVVEWLTDGHRYLAPDGVLRASDRGPTISVLNVQTGASADIIKSKHMDGVFWAPNSRMFLYREAAKVKDHAAARSEESARLWLAGTETHKLNTVCLALGTDEEVLPTWSSDSLKVACVCRGRLHVVALRKRKPTPEEKAHAGLPLTEQEQQKLVLEDLKYIGYAITTFRADYDDGRLPDAARVEDDLQNYLGGHELVFRPNPSQGFFRYFPENLAGMREEDRCRTIIAEFDLGYDWKAVLYADGHVQIVSK